MKTVIRIVVAIVFLGLITIGIIFFRTILDISHGSLLRRGGGESAMEVGGIATSTAAAKAFFEKYFSSLASQGATSSALSVEANNAQEQSVAQESSAAAPLSREPLTPPGTVEMPKQSSPVTKAQLPPEAMRVTVSSRGFSPSSFEVSAGADVGIALEATDPFSHVLQFDSPLLNGIVLAASARGSGIRVIAFRAPRVKGEYLFRCGVPGHAERGEVGRMIVK